MKKAIVDIDGILWNMQPPWYEELCKVNKDCPYPGLDVWHFYKGFLTNEEANKTIKTTHMRQHLYFCFDRACRLTSLLQNLGYYVIIASHRDVDTLVPTKTWLRENGINYDELFLGDDKMFLVDKDDVFVDDCPDSQEKALKKGVKVFSIKYPYNKHVKGVHFYEDFDALVGGVEKELS